MCFIEFSFDVQHTAKISSSLSPQQIADILIHCIVRKKNNNKTNECTHFFLRIFMPRKRNCCLIAIGNFTVQFSLCAVCGSKHQNKEKKKKNYKKRETTLNRWTLAFIVDYLNLCNKTPFLSLFVATFCCAQQPKRKQITIAPQFTASPLSVLGENEKRSTKYCVFSKFFHSI